MDSSLNAPSLRASEAPFPSSRADEIGVAIHNQKVDSSVKMDCHDFAAAKSRNDSKTTTPHANEARNDKVSDFLRHRELCASKAWRSITQKTQKRILGAEARLKLESTFYIFVFVP
ncbi:hypothetical protein [Helicobacter canis]|uniref:Uncharacterized protein n=1 Tax=Helicobacter canis TaxID=29419 RepID=A0A377J3S6_9HELI|nr:hypothetical protein [Helicobacter canis]STO96433.1 Uncharacterised protein [Helicobacter canis]